MILELVILLRVEHFEQRSRGVAAETVGVAQFIDFVQHEQRVDGARAFHGLDDAARKRADVRAAMPPNFGLVVHAAHGDAHELAPE